jgi:hypothetical protein
MRNYYRLVIGILLMMGGCSFTRDYFSDTKKLELEQKIMDVERLIASPTETTAILDSVYSITTIKIMGAPVKFYETKYFFNANNQSFTGIYKPTEPPTIPLIKIKYLAEDPAINSPDPQDELNSLKTSKTSNASLYIGLFLLGAGGLTVYSNVRQIRQRKREEEAETERKIEEFNRSKGIM